MGVYDIDGHILKMTSNGDLKGLKKLFKEKEKVMNWNEYSEDIMDLSINNNRINIVKFLLENNFYDSVIILEAMDTAVLTNRKKIFKLLMRVAKNNGFLTTAIETTLLETAVYNGRYKITQEMIIENFSLRYKKSNALSIAIEEYQYPIARLLINNGANPRIEKNKLMKKVADRYYHNNIDEDNDKDMYLFLHNHGAKKNYLKRKGKK